MTKTAAAGLQRDILSELQPPRGLGFIIRTAGLDRTKKELQRDLAYLSRLWQVVVKRIRKLKSPVEIYQESDMITRTIRDTFTSDIDTIWVDEIQRPTRAAKEFMSIVMPPLYAARIKYWDSTEADVPQARHRARNRAYSATARPAAARWLDRHRPDGSAGGHRREQW